MFIYFWVFVIAALTLIVAGIIVYLQESKERYQKEEKLIAHYESQFEKLNQRISVLEDQIQVLQNHK